MYKLRNRRQCECEGSSSESGRAGKCAVPFHSDTFTGCPYHVSEICHGNTAQPDGKDFYRMGLVLPRKNMANWVIRCSEDWFTPIYERIHECMIQKCENLHMDETRIQVNKEPGKRQAVILLCGFCKVEQVKNKSYTISLFQNPQQESCCRFVDRISWISHNGCLHSIRESEHGWHKEQLLLVACAKILC